MTSFLVPTPRASAVPVLHVVTNDDIVARPDFVDTACAIMHTAGDRCALHLRASRLADEALLALAGGLRAAGDLTGAWTVVNERVGIAVSARARGVQLTRRSVGVIEAREAAPGLAVGASVHGYDAGLEAAAAGADWLVASQLFADPTGRGAGSALLWFARLALAVRAPVVAIGGVTLKDVAPLWRQGARGLAVIRGIWDAPNAEQAASDYLSAYDDAARP